MRTRNTRPGKLSVRDLTIDFSSPVVMGILNTTPDSFSDGGIFNTVQSAVKQVRKMVQEGALIIDIGGESTRPGSDPVSEEEELSRVMPVLKQAVSEFPEIIFSIDTTKFNVAEKALQAGAHIINDVSGLRKEPRFGRLCSDYDAGYILMHSVGNPKNMQKNPEYEDTIGEIGTFFEKNIQKLKENGVKSIIIDPGIGFGKTLQHNLEIIDSLQKFSKFNCPVMVGASRKSMIGELLQNRPVENRLAGTLAVHYHCLMQGASILRVHDVQEAADSICVFNALRMSTE